MAHGQRGRPWAGGWAAEKTQAAGVQAAEGPQKPTVPAA